MPIIEVTFNGLLNAGFSSTSGKAIATHGKTKGKWYWELRTSSLAFTNGYIGVANKKYKDGSGNLSFVIPKNLGLGTESSIIGVALDMDNYTMKFYVDGVESSVLKSNLDDLGEVYPYIGSGTSAALSFSANFGATPFVCPIPNGYEPYNFYFVKKILFSSGDGKIVGIKKGKLITTNAIPVMTSNTTPSGVAFASSIFNETRDAWKAFDNIDTSSSFWQSRGEFPARIGYEFPNPIRIEKYAMNNHADTNAPKNWTFEGSNDGDNWTVLDTRNNITFVAFTLTEFEIKAGKIDYFKMYRLNITTSKSGTDLVLAGLRMYEAPQDVLVRFPSQSEKLFIDYGIEAPVSLGEYLDVIDIVSDNTALGEGKTFEHTVDLGERKVNKITLG